MATIELPSYEDLLTSEIIRHPLFPVLLRVIDQVTSGKGTRHGGGETAFMLQPWRALARVHGRGFLTGQAEKKLQEAVSRGLTGEEFEREVLGAIAYIGMAILCDRTRES